MANIAQARVCAWCLADNGEEAKEESHGICDTHAEQELIKWYWNKLQSVPSYVEQQAREFAEEE